MPALRSRTTTFGREAAGARSLWRATGMTDDDFGKPIVAIANSFTQFVPGHAPAQRRRDRRRSRPRGRWRGWANSTPSPSTTASPGHGGMLYSLPSREIIAGLRRIHGQRALPTLWCASNCDKITPACSTPRWLNIPTCSSRRTDGSRQSGGGRRCGCTRRRT